MRYLIFLVILFSGKMVFSDDAINFNLAGEWVVDKDKTLDFANKNFYINETMYQLLTCKLPNTRLYLTQSKVALVIKSYTCRQLPKELNIDESMAEYKVDEIKLMNKTFIFKFLNDDFGASFILVTELNVNEIFVDEISPEFTFRTYYYRNKAIQ